MSAIRDQRSIAIVIPELRQHGGAERVVVRTVSHLLRQGHAVTIYTCGHDSAFLLENDCAGARLVQLSKWNDTVDRYNEAPGRWEREIGQHDIYVSHLFPTNKLRLRPHVCYIHEPLRQIHDLEMEGPFWETDFNVKAYGDLSLQTPYVPSPHRLISDEEAALFSVAETARGYVPDVVIANSKKTSAQLAEVYSLENVPVIHPGCDHADSPWWDHPDWWPQRSSPRPFRVLLLGAIAYHKRWRLAVEAIARFADVELYVVGQGPELGYAEDLVGKLGLQNRVFFLRQTTDPVLERIWSSIDASVLCSLNEPFGIAPMESAMRGIPPIVDSTAGVMEILGEQCVSVNADAGSLADAIEKLKSDDNEYIRVARGVREIAVRHTWSEFNTRFDKVLTDVLRNQPVRRAEAADSLGTILSYNINFGRNDVEKFGKYVPVVGRYGSHEGWVLQRHARRILELGFERICLTLSVGTWEEIVISLRALQRFIAIAGAESDRVQFAMGIRFSDSHTINSAVPIVRYWSQLREARKLCVGGRPAVYLDLSLSKATSLVELAMAFEDVQFLVDRQHPAIGKLDRGGNNVRGVRIEYAGSGGASSTSETVMLECFNDFRQHRFLEAVFKDDLQ